MERTPSFGRQRTDHGILQAQPGVQAVGRSGRARQTLRPRRGFGIARPVGFAGALALMASCAATTSIVREPPVGVASAITMCPVFVMWPTIAPAALRGSVGVRPWDIESAVAHRILEVVQEQCPDGNLLRPTPVTPLAAIPGYVAAVGGGEVTTDEWQVAAAARDRGASYLLVPTIQRWNQRRTDDPIGAFIGPHNSIGVSVRLMRLQSPALAGRVTFLNRSRITLNQPAARLLDDGFRTALRQLLRNPRPVEPACKTATFGRIT